MKCVAFKTRKDNYIFNILVLFGNENVKNKYIYSVFYILASTIHIYKQRKGKVAVTLPLVYSE